ncbi:MAG TPA: hypothetical protein VK632_13555, partial [Verrucomicrobiae bacterium]|nr:hypothetical protein [Verrucomicrobiae bacterium]
MSAFDAELQNHVSEGSVANTAGATVDEIFAGNTITSESLLPYERIGKQIKPILLLVKSDEKTIGIVVVGIEVAAMALSVEVFIAEAMPDGQFGIEEKQILRGELRCMRMIHIGK